MCLKQPFVGKINSGRIYSPVQKPSGKIAVSQKKGPLSIKPFFTHFLSRKRLLYFN